MSNYTGGVLNRRKRALERNERSLKIKRVNLEKVNQDMDKQENDAASYNASTYRVLIAMGESYDASVCRIEKEIEVLKTRI